MCGFSGVFNNSRGSELDTIIQKMNNSIVHRGPDDSGVWVDSAMKLALGHRRLAIVDLTSAGHQPMLSSCNRYVIVFKDRKSVV